MGDDLKQIAYEELLLPLLVNFLEIFLRQLGIGLHRRRSLLPSSRAYLAHELRNDIHRSTFPVLIGVLESANQTQRFLHGATDRQIVDGDLAELSGGVNDEETTATN